MAVVWASRRAAVGRHCVARAVARTGSSSANSAASGMCNWLSVYGTVSIQHEGMLPDTPPTCRALSAMAAADTAGAPVSVVGALTVVVVLVALGETKEEEEGGSPASAAEAGARASCGREAAEPNRWSYWRPTPRPRVHRCRAQNCRTALVAHVAH